MLLTSFTRWPALTSPQWTMRSAKQSSTGRISARVAGSPPVIRQSLPASASFGVRLIGMSTKRPLLAWIAAAIFRVESGIAVVQSASTMPLCRPARRPSSRNTMSSSWVELPTTVMTRSLFAAISRGLFSSFAPLPTRSSTGPRLRFARIES